MNADCAAAPALPLLQLEQLSVTFATEAGPLPAVQGVDFSLCDGETTCLVGESGCGKSLTARAILRLTPENAVLSGRVLLRGTDLLALREKDMQAVRGRKIGMVFQEPMT
ncbi:MAG: ATP-binding cassette domain-containing protein, partial [Desulfovibrio sp.]|nr:ATP-binding cassette domain-containing protein [Desulfovibrio sp.]